jgi:integrase
VIQELKTSKLNYGCCRPYVQTLGIVLNQFARGRESQPVNQFSHLDIESFMSGKKLVSRSTLRNRLSTLFTFCIRRGYRTDNPCARLEPIKVPYKPPKIFTADQFKTAVTWLVANVPAGLAWFALSTLCGLRPEEAEKTTAKDIHFGEGYIRVEAQTTKVRQRRVVYPKAEAMEFLKWSIEQGGKLPIGKSFRRRFVSGPKYNGGGLRHALGFTAWPKDITRHTAASYWLASGETAGVVSEMLGNSERILKRDYKALVTKAEAVEFWRGVSELSK